jgi:predicted nucleotidyltransferase
MSNKFLSRNIMKTQPTSKYLELLKQYKEKNGHKYGIVRLGIFGSVARGIQTEDSDIDIYIEGEPQSLFTMSHIKMELQDLLGREVDIVRLREKMNPYLREKIEKEGIYA